MDKNRYCVIMAGGVGSRFWPISRTHRPKQFLDILNTGKSFIRQTYERFAEIIPPENFLVVTNVDYKELTLEHIPELKEDQVLCEPLGRNTAPCIAYAAYKLKMANPEATMIVTPADHLVLNPNEFIRLIGEGIDFAETHEALVTIGIQPSRPDTGYGYIQVDSQLTEGNLHKVKTFTEKPNLEMAKVFLESGEFFWNSGIFIWRVSEIIKEFKLYLPDMDMLFESIRADYNTPEESGAIRRIYPECRNISIDYGIMEKAENVYVRCGEFGWSDIGTWNSLYMHATKDEKENAVNGDAFTYDTERCIVNIPKEKIAVIQGLDGFIVVDTEDALLICPKENEQNIRSFVEDMRLKKGDRYI